MSSSREEILGRIRQAIGKPDPLPPSVRDYRQSGPVDLEDFAEKLQDYNAVVYRCPQADLPAIIEEAAAARGKRRLVIPPLFPAEWLPGGVEFVRDEDLSYADIDGSEGALTACTVAIAMTGTIILSHDIHEGRRAITLIPDYHLCIVRADQVVATVPEGIRQLRDCRTRPITTISGPSATADIEMTRIKGVHGPRTLDVIIAE